ncbi:TadE/TadG family type IV pilus assembly protein [Streptomyces fenghuangensis]|uniref:TadE/TadG family type IV pilus assembly protein n=1 Tax=Streptomyces sp. ICN903 TaxID=2964654 RepID=UPI001EDB2931|nr:TadE family protein [Streptomyces sp. ICN903]MCG3041516.1 pilus assembly protein [Streptomyces sp. ICN903]
MGIRGTGRDGGTGGLPPRDDRGQVAVEFASMAPIILVTLVLLWQAALVGYAFSLAGNAADKAVRAGATTDTWRQSRNQACDRAGREDLPDTWTATIRCYEDGDMVEAVVRVKVPVLFPGGVDFPLWISGRTAAAKES